MSHLLSVTPRWISDWFKKADKNKDGRMNFKEVQDLLKMMNVDMNEHHAHRLFTVWPFFSNQVVAMLVICCIYPLIHVHCILFP